LPTPSGETQKTICDWAVGTFGEPDSVERLLARLNDEYIELVNAVLLGDDVEGEAADVVVVLYQLCQKAGIDLKVAVDNKMIVNRARKWSVTADGVGQHID